MRSNTTNSAIKRSNKRSKSRLPLALTAIVAVFALGSVADAAQRMGASGGFAGHCFSRPRSAASHGDQATICQSLQPTVEESGGPSDRRT